MDCSYSPCFACSETKLIIDLNNDGVKMMSFGDIPSALSCFRRALEKSKTLINTIRDIDNAHEEDTKNIHQRQQDDAKRLEIDCLLLEAGSNNNSTDFTGTGRECKSSSSPYFSPLQRTTNEKDGNHNDALLTSAYCDSSSSTSDNCETDFIYDRPIHVPNRYAHDEVVQRSETALPSVIIFNLALLHHSWAARIPDCRKWNGENTSRRSVKPALMKLKQAAGLYKLAIQLQSNNKEDDTSLASNGAKLFILSCMNNLGSVYRLMGDKHSDKLIHDQLLTILMYLMYSEQHHQQRAVDIAQNENTISSSCFYRKFFFNIFKSESMLNAAAA